MPIGKKRARKFISILKDVSRTATMKNACFDGSMGSADPFELPKTEKEVTEFIQGRTRLWRQSWIIEPVDGVIKELENYL